MYKIFFRDENNDYGFVSANDLNTAKQLANKFDGMVMLNGIVVYVCKLKRPPQQ